MPGHWRSERFVSEQGQRAMHLRQLCVDHNMLAVNQPEVLVARAHEKFDDEGRLTHDVTRHFVRLLMEALLEWTWKVEEDASQ